MEANDTCYGVEILNENQPNPGESHKHQQKFLQTYYTTAIKFLREEVGFPMDKPIIVYAWSTDYKWWPDNLFPYETYGRVQWDTHLYPVVKGTGKTDIDTVVGVYTNTLVNKIEPF